MVKWSGKNGIYERFVKRLLDLLGSSLVLLLFWWILLFVALMVRIKLGAPVLYTAERVGKNGRTFRLLKYRSMTNARDEQGNLLPDAERLTRFGRWLRATSLDELPEVLNIWTGKMSFIGPRPLPASYIEYYTEAERHRHDVRPGLSGWAQVHGRNSISWERKFSLDVWYADRVSFLLDLRTMGLTVLKVVRRADIGQGEQAPQSLYNERRDWVKTANGALPPAQGRRDVDGTV